MVNVEADRNLLFGILALQNGFIDQAALIAAFHVWSRDKSRTIAGLLRDRGDLSPSRADLLGALVEEHVRQHEGDPRKSLAALSSGDGVRGRLGEVDDADLRESLARIPVLRPEYANPLALSCSADSMAPTAAFHSTPSRGDERFRILRPHAQGGLGAIFVALDGELNREVALKQIQGRHADDAECRSRFLLEAEVTGGLEHPGIVPVYSLGHDPTGRPYYAMRFIKGDNLKQAIERFHADDAPGRDPGERNLALQKLLRRFLDVCNAVAYAHSRGVLHRDIKPGNVMVGQYGETLVVDWGLAKLVGTPETSGEATLRPPSAGESSETLPGSAIGTPQFMSPEQASGRLDQLGPASDVYSLGATLYCLLTGKPPFTGRDFGEMLRRVQRGEFPPPRQVDRSIHPALDAICLKAMALRPEDRHASTRALADDVERWLADEPVSAWREPWQVRARRWLSRNRTRVTAAAASGLVALVALAAILAIVTGKNRQLTAINGELVLANGREIEAKRVAVKAADEANRSFAKADAVNRFLTERLLGQASPEKNPRGEGVAKVTVEELLDRAAREIDTAFAGQPDVEATIRGTIGSTYDALGEFAKAEPHLRESLAIRLRLVGKDDPATLSAVNNLALLRMKRGEFEEAEAMFRRDLDASRRVLGGDDPATLQYQSNLGILLTKRGKMAEAESMLRRNLEARRRVLGPLHPDALQTANNLASTLSDRGNLAEAEPLAREVLAGRRQVKGPAHPDTLIAANNVAHLLMLRGKLAEAEPMLREGLASSRRVLGNDHPGTLTAAINLAEVLRELGKLDEAEPLYLEYIDVYRRVLGRDHPDTLTATNNVAALLQARGKLAEAERMYRLTLEDGRRVRGPDHADTLTTAVNLARLLQLRGKVDEAETVGRRALEDGRRALGEAHPVTMAARNNLALLFRALGRSAEAEPLYRRNLEALRRALGPEHPHTLGSMKDMSDVLIDVGKLREAESILGEALRGYRRARPPDPSRILLTAASQGRVLMLLDRPAEAEPLFRECLTAWRKSLPPRDPRIAFVESMLGGCLTKLGRLDEAEPLVLSGARTLAAARAAPFVAREAFARVADCHEARGRPREAAAWRARGLDYGFPANPFAR